MSEPRPARLSIRSLLLVVTFTAVVLGLIQGLRLPPEVARLPVFCTLFAFIIATEGGEQVRTRVLFLAALVAVVSTVILLSLVAID